MSSILKMFMKAHFDFSTNKKAGIYPKEMKHTDYEGQAKIICHLLGLESIYDYNKHEVRCHISYAGHRPLEIDEKGNFKEYPFITVINENQMHL